jgi:hypothetical protein
MLSRKQAPAARIAAFCQQRWDIENSCGELVFMRTT